MPYPNIHYSDESGQYCCPRCRHASELSFTAIPEHRRVYTVNGEEHTTHLPEVRDYECGDCGFFWSLGIEQA